MAITESYHSLDPGVYAEKLLWAELDAQCLHQLCGERFHWIWQGPVTDDSRIMWEFNGQLLEVHYCWCRLDRDEIVPRYGRCINPDCVDCNVDGR